MKNNVKVQDDTQSLQSCVSVSVTDFRIGNLVHYNGNNKEIGKISLLVSDMVEALSYCQINYRRDKKHWLINLQPVKLTEDWLIAFGNAEIKPCSLGVEVLERFIFIWKESYKYWYVVTKDSYEYLTKIEFIHEYQNFIFALNGSELQVGNLTEH